MTAADRRAAVDGGAPRRVKMNGGAVETVPYRRAVSLISRGMATWAPEPKRKRKAPTKKVEEPVESDLSGAVTEGDQDADSVENEPTHNLL